MSRLICKLTGKVMFLSKDEARVVGIVYGQRKYRCESCGGYHLTSMTDRQVWRAKRGKHGKNSTKRIKTT